MSSLPKKKKKKFRTYEYCPQGFKNAKTQYLHVQKSENVYSPKCQICPRYARVVMNFYFSCKRNLLNPFRPHAHRNMHVYLDDNTEDGSTWLPKKFSYKI